MQSINMDTKDLIKGTPTKTGKDTFLFYNKDGKIIHVMYETAKKNGYKPVIKGNHRDENMSEIDINTKKSNNLNDIDDIHQKAIQKLKEKKAQQIKTNNKLDNVKSEETKELPIPRKELTPSEQKKYEELISKRKKVDKDREQFDKKIKDELRKQIEKEEEVKRLQSVREKHEQQKKESKSTDTVVNKPTEKIEPIPVTPHKPTLKEKMEMKEKKKDDSIIKNLYSDTNPFKDYIEKNDSFEIFYNGNLIYTSKNTSKDKIKLFDNYFELFGKRYPYAGLRFKKL